MLNLFQHRIRFRTKVGITALLIAGLTAAPFLSACRSDQKTDLLVSAAADLTPAFQEIGQNFEKETGIRISFNFGSSGQLAQQIQAGAPADIFAAANVSYVNDLERQGMVVPGTQALYARGRLVLWTRTDTPFQINTTANLNMPEIKRIALANPSHAPYGVAARQALQKAGLWDSLQPKLVLGENVQQAFQYAATGNADVALASLSLAIQNGGRYVLVPQELYNPLDQALAVVKGTRHEAEARRFIFYVNSPPGRAIMHNYGFTLPGEE